MTNLCPNKPSPYPALYAEQSLRPSPKRQNSPKPKKGLHASRPHCILLVQGQCACPCDMVVVCVVMGSHGLRTMAGKGRNARSSLSLFYEL
jgi:hypothetical protein